MKKIQMIYLIGTDVLGFPIYVVHEKFDDEAIIEKPYPEIKNKRKPLDIIKHRLFKANLKK